MNEEYKPLNDDQTPQGESEISPLIPGTEIIGRRARKMAMMAEEAEEQIPLWDPAQMPVFSENSPEEQKEQEEQSPVHQAAFEHPEEEEPQSSRFSKKSKAAGKKASAVSPFVELMEIVVGALVAAILVLTLICRTGVVDGSSMVPTMYHGDRYVISDLFYTPKQGDIVVFRPDIGGEEELWIKRVIAVEGQTVYIDPETYRVYVDGEMLDEPYLKGMGTIPHTTQNPITVPEGCIYVLGDNRSISHDSRYEDLGCVEIGQLAGRVILRFWPVKDFDFYL